MADFKWDDDATEKLRRLWGEGMSASGIAARMGSCVSRNAVIGKIHRLGLAGRSAAPRRDRPRPTPQKRSPTHVERAPRPKVAVPEVPLPPIEEVVIPLAERKTLQMLTETCCRWPIGDPQMADFHFCGKTKVMGLPYCEHHARRAVQPKSMRRAPAPAEPREYVLVEA